MLTKYILSIHSAYQISDVTDKHVVNLSDEKQQISITNIYYWSTLCEIISNDSVEKLIRILKMIKKSCISSKENRVVVLYILLNPFIDMILHFHLISLIFENRTKPKENIRGGMRLKLK